MREEKREIPTDFCSLISRTNGRRYSQPVSLFLSNSLPQGLNKKINLFYSKWNNPFLAFDGRDESSRKLRPIRNYGQKKRVEKPLFCHATLISKKEIICYQTVILAEAKPIPGREVVNNIRVRAHWVGVAPSTISNYFGVMISPSLTGVVIPCF